jgi:hypothetical protein
MKKLIRVSLIMVFALITAISVNAQNKNIKIKAEKVDGGVKIVSTENGKTSEFVVSLEEAEDYIKKVGGSIDIDVSETGDNNYKISYAVDNGNTETVEVDLESLMENLSLDFSELTEDLKQAVKEIASEIEYEESTDENGNKTYKIKSKREAK